MRNGKMLEWMKGLPERTEGVAAFLNGLTMVNVWRRRSIRRIGENTGTAEERIAEIQMVELSETAAAGSLSFFSA